uniref:SET domain-containing protein n=1 Tax=Skeletonema marinoi TaxID=267567 RepID=A0A7S2PY17_9STRA|mmetsp:Transcript_5439/g.9086  ORF Transcript_5439/g.9086 Transcript_5439/m.9086 type:complete len:286 (+) Transcript_5439:78-935(+)
MASRIKITSLLRRRRGDDAMALPTSMTGADDKRSIMLGRRRKSYSPSLVKYILGFGVLSLMIFHRRNKGIISPRLRVAMRTYKHKDWRNWGRHNFRNEFQCSRHLRETTKSVPTLDYWQTLRDVYNSEVDSSFVFDDLPPTQGYTLNENGAPPYYAKLSPGKGRSLFASRDIKEGELVDGIEGGTKSDLIFTTVEALQRYLLALPEPMACDVLEWSYTQKLVKGGPAVLLVASDISSLMNDAWGDDVANVGPKDKTSSTLLYANRDIGKNEEILMSYGVFPPGLW